VIARHEEIFVDEDGVVPKTLLVAFGREFFLASSLLLVWLVTTLFV
jgi:hypothetical protein